MIDYISTEIVQYVDFLDPFYHYGIADSCYTEEISKTYVYVSEVKPFYTWYYPVLVSETEKTYLVSIGALDQEFVDKYTKLYWLHCIVNQDGKYVSVGYQLYYLNDTLVTFTYYRRSVWIETLNTSFNPVIEGEDVFWLYNFGHYIAINASNISGVLSRDIHGVNLIYLLATSGFLVYMTWSVIKWFIPL